MAGSTGFDDDVPAGFNDADIETAEIVAEEKYRRGEYRAYVDRFKAEADDVGAELEPMGYDEWLAAHYYWKEER